jgi:hypothetical protein
MQTEDYDTSCIWQCSRLADPGQVLTICQGQGFSLKHSHCRSPNFAQFMGMCQDDKGRIMVVMEYMRGGNLSDAIANGHVSWFDK